MRKYDAPGYRSKRCCTPWGYSPGVVMFPNTTIPWPLQAGSLIGIGNFKSPGSRGGAGGAGARGEGRVGAGGWMTVAVSVTVSGGADCGDFGASVSGHIEVGCGGDAV